MRLLYIGDIMGSLGVKVTQEVLAQLQKEQAIDVVIAQAENVTEGKGISLSDFSKLKSLGISFFTGGNWTLERPDILPALNDPDEPIIRPANYLPGTPGMRYKYLKTAEGDILFVSLLGHIVGKDADKPLDNPLKSIDAILEKEASTPKIATIVNFHGDYSSEKVVIGHYLDGRVTAVIGDHWHVPTADARILPKRTAHITDVGMCGALNSSLGVKLPVIINRWRDDVKARNELVESGPCQFNGVLIDIDTKSGLAKSIEHISKIID